MSEQSVPMKQRGKRWYTILSPEEYGTTPLGETIAEDPAQVEGWTVEVTQGDLTDTQGANNTKLTFRVTSVTCDSAYTGFVLYNTNTDARIIQRVPLADGTVITKWDFKKHGVPNINARVEITFSTQQNL